MSHAGDMLSRAHSPIAQSSNESPNRQSSIISVPPAPQFPQARRPGPGGGGHRHRLGRRGVGHGGGRALRRRPPMGHCHWRVLQVRAERGYRAVATGHWSDRGGGLGRVPPEVGEGLLRHLPRALDRRGQRGADQCHGPGHRQPHRRRRAAILGGGGAQPDRRCARLGGRLRALREADEGARRGHGLQHPDLRRPHDDQPRTGPAGIVRSYHSRRTAAATCCRSSAASADRSRCCPTTTGCARKRCRARNI